MESHIKRIHVMPNEACHAERGCMQPNSASLVQGRSRIKFGMTVVAAGPGWRWWQAGMTCVMPNEACHAERSNVMLNSIQHLLHKGDPESSSG